MVFLILNASKPLVMGMTCFLPLTILVATNVNDLLLPLSALWLAASWTWVGPLVADKVRALALPFLLTLIICSALGLQGRAKTVPNLRLCAAGPLFMRWLPRQRWMEGHREQTLMLTPPFLRFG